MSQQLPIPEPLWSTVPEDAQAALFGVWKALRDEIPALKATVRDLQARTQLDEFLQAALLQPIGLKRRPPAPPSRRTARPSQGVPRLGPVRGAPLVHRL